MMNLELTARKDLPKVNFVSQPLPKELFNERQVKIMNGLKKELKVDKWSNINQKQFNDLINNLSTMDKSSAKSVLNEIPKLENFINEYFKTFADAFKNYDNEFLKKAKEHQELLKELMLSIDNPAIKDKIIDEMLEHSSWLRKEASTDANFKRLVIGIGIGVGLLVVGALLFPRKSIDDNSTNVLEPQIDEKQETVHHVPPIEHRK